LLFDTPRLVGHLEELYQQMWRDFEQSLLPIPDSTNLDIYHKIGLDLDIENIDMLSESGYHASIGKSSATGIAIVQSGAMEGAGRRSPGPDNLFTRAARTHTL
jgi:hypothetical protein